MRVVVIGASGNVGTAVLRRFARADEVDSLVAIARRPPGPDAGTPYDAARWHRVDIAGPQAPTVLTRLLRGAGAVIHLGGAIQPSHRPDVLHRVNVTGSRQVVDAVVEARVPNLVYASSLGAYGPHPLPDRPVTEEWPVTGIPGSVYSEDKAAVERLLDEVTASGSAPTITRFRPALIFQQEAASEIARYFAGPFVPFELLRPLGGRVPVVPFPAGFRFQVVHADDVADAYLAAVLAAPGGAVNLAADPILTGPRVAEALGGVHVPVPYGLTALAANLTWRARVHPTSPGWLRLARYAPLLDSTRARRELGWTPRYDGVACLRELVAGFAAGSGTPSPPLLPRTPLPCRRRG